MSVQNVSSVNSVNFKGNQAGSKDNNTTQPQNNVKDGKKKLILALSGLAVAGAVTAGIIYKVRKGKGLSSKDTQAAVDAINNGTKAAANTGTKADSVEATIKSALKKKPTNPNAQCVKYRRKFKQNGVNVTEFYEGDKLVKKTTSQAFPEQKYVKVKTEYPHGEFEDKYFMMGDKNRSILVQDGFNTHLDAQIATGGKLKPEAPKYDISFKDGGSYGTSSANSTQEVQEFVDKLGLPFRIDNLGTSKESQMNFIAKNLRI